MPMLSLQFTDDEYAALRARSQGLQMALRHYGASMIAQCLMDRHRLNDLEEGMRRRGGRPRYFGPPAKNRGPGEP